MCTCIYTYVHTHICTCMYLYMPSETKVVLKHPRVWHAEATRGGGTRGRAVAAGRRARNAANSLFSKWLPIMVAALFRGHTGCYSCLWAYYTSMRECLQKQPRKCTRKAPLSDRRATSEKPANKRQTYSAMTPYKGPPKYQYHVDV